MGIFDLFNGSKGWLTSKDVEVGKDYKYMAEYADRRRKGVTSCRTLKRKVKSKYMKAKRHDFDMQFDMGGGISGRYFLCERTRRYSRVASGDDGVSANDGCGCDGDGFCIV
jgi:hypothetical protein